MKNKLIAFYAGSFDPFTNGHLCVVRQAAKVFDEVVVAIGENPRKKRVFELEDMRRAMEKMVGRLGWAGVRVIKYGGLTVEAAKKVGAEFLIRGLRNGVDYDFEENLAAVNRKLGGLETIYFRAGETAHLSSSMVVELWRNGAEIDFFVEKEIQDLMLRSRESDSA